jgi:hypothetical protein
MIGSALALGMAAALPAQAHELRRLGTGDGEFGERFRMAFGHWKEPAREDLENGIDFTSVYREDGTSDGNVVDQANGDRVDIRKIKVMFFKAVPDASSAFGYRVGQKINSAILCDQDATPAITHACIRQKLDSLDTFGDPTNSQPDTTRNKYINTFIPTDSGIYGYELHGCIEDNVQQPDDDMSDNYQPTKYCFGNVPANTENNPALVAICGAGSQDPRNNPGDPEETPTNHTHSFGCITDTPTFGAEQGIGGKNLDGYKDSDKFNVPDAH